MARVVQGDLYESENGINPKTTSNWYVFDEPDESLAKAALVNSVPTVVDNLLLMNMQLKYMSSEHYEATLAYGVYAIPDVGEVRLTASTKGGKAVITQALETFDSVGYDPGTGVIPAPDTQGAIGVDEHGNVSGVEITVPQPVFSLEATVDFSLFSRNFWRNLSIATGAVNRSPFWGYRAHELMFLGCDFDGSIRLNPGGTTQTGRLRFDFAVSESKLYTGTGTGVVIPGLERGIGKRGWDHLEIRYGRFYDALAGVEIKRPIAAWSRQVAPAINYSSRFGIS